MARENMNLNGGGSKPAPIPFLFEEEYLIRVVQDRNGEPWFVARDVCQALAIKQATAAVRVLAADEKGVISIHTLGGHQEVLSVSEGGLFTIALRCRGAMKPGTTPYRLRRWVTHEVLPAIRRNGYFGVSPSPLTPGASKAANARFNAGVRFLAEIRRCAGARVAAKALPAICKQLGIPIDLSISSTLSQGELDLPPP
jgi:prophage antirepressor-like protein